jgi:hypothetical protein
MTFLSKIMSEIQTITTLETSKTRKRKLLTNPESLWTSCRACKEPGNLENMVYQRLSLKDQEGKEIFGAFEGVYFCSESCQRLFIRETILEN